MAAPGSRAGGGSAGAAARQRARAGEPLALAAGQRVPLLADPRLESPRKVPYEAGLRDVDRPLQLLVRHDGPAHHEVLVHRSGEEDRVLERESDVRPERAQQDLADVDPVEQDAPLRYVVEARHQV